MEAIKSPPALVPLPRRSALGRQVLPAFKIEAPIRRKHLLTMKLLKVSLLLSAANAGAQALTDIGTLGGSTTAPLAVSGDGSTIVGNSNNGGNHARAFRWTSAGMTDLGTFGGATSNARAVSADGSVVVGNAALANGNPNAFRWTAAGMVNLCTLGGFASTAYAVSADGSVVAGGAYDANSELHAFRWTAAGMVDLGTLGGIASEAVAISADGNVLAGFAQTAGADVHAFRWTSAGMADLGTLGGATSSAKAISADGNVVVGLSHTLGGQQHAFRWTSAGMADLGTLGGVSSAAEAVSADGSVVVGSARVASGYLHAFRWTSAGMADLGTLGGTISSACGVSADGSVVIGNAYDAQNRHRAFRWTSAGMVDLGTLGGAESFSVSVSSDGNTITGQAMNAGGQLRGFLYNNRVMLDVQDWLGSVGGVRSMLSTTLELSRLHNEGAHHRPLADLGRGRSYWATGDVSSSSRTRDLLTRSGEAGATFEPRKDILVGIGAGYGLQDQDLMNQGSARTSGQYLVGEVDLIQADGGIFSLLLSAGDWHNDTQRGYVTGGGVDYSHGETDLTSKAFRLRYDSPVLGRLYGADFKSYVSYGQTNIRSDAYDETGGSYAGSFGATDLTAKESRLGLVLTRAFGDKTKVRLSAEWIRRFDHDQTALTATDITSSLSLSLPTPDPVRNQARFGVDFDHALDARTTLSFTVHASGLGESADVSGAISLRRGF